MGVFDNATHKWFAEGIRHAKAQGCPDIRETIHAISHIVEDPDNLESWTISTSLTIGDCYVPVLAMPVQLAYEISMFNPECAYMIWRVANTSAHTTCKPSELQQIEKWHCILLVFSTNKLDSINPSQLNHVAIANRPANLLQLMAYSQFIGNVPV